MATLPAALPALLARYRDPIEAALRDAIAADASPLAASARYVMGWEDGDGRATAAGGKRIRPALCLLAAEIVAGDPRRALPGAVAVELVHNFSLVHDEVQDRDAERHHRPTIWTLVGEAQAINVGDYLYTRAVAALTGGGDDPERRLRALAVLNDAIARMIAGQWQDIAFERREDVTVDEYLAMVAGKTGALLGAPLEIGALLAGADPAQAALLGRWGVQVGLAFQAQDDYLGTWGDPNNTGKSNSNDILRRKKTLPIVIGLADPVARDAVRAVYGAPGEVGPEGVARVVAALEACGADRECRERGRGYIAAAEEILGALDLVEEARGQLRAVATYLVERPR